MKNVVKFVINVGCLLIYWRNFKIKLKFKEKQKKFVWILIWQVQLVKQRK